MNKISREIIIKHMDWKPIVKKTDKMYEIIFKKKFGMVSCFSNKFFYPFDEYESKVDENINEFIKRNINE